LLREEQLADVLVKKELSRKDFLLILLAVSVDVPKTVKVIKEMGSDNGFAEIQKWNVSVTLGKAKGLALRLKDGWSLTSNGRKHVTELDVLPHNSSAKVINQSTQLRLLISKIVESDTQSFLNEAINAYEYGLYRSAVVLSWAGAVSLLYDQVIKTKLQDFNKEASRLDPKWKHAKSKDDLGRMKESSFLDIIGSPPISIIGKNLKENLKVNCLKLRNSCGHPNSFQIGENMTSAHLETLILNVFTKFS
jgi:hypothetical protein